MELSVSLQAMPLLLLAAGSLGGLHAASYGLIQRAIACAWPRMRPLPALVALALAFLLAQGLAIGLPAAGLPSWHGPPMLWAAPLLLVGLAVVGVGLRGRGGWALCLEAPLLARDLGLRVGAYARTLVLLAVLLLVAAIVIRAALPTALILPSVTLVPFAAVLLFPAWLAVMATTLAYATDAAVGLVQPDVPAGLAGAAVMLVAALVGDVVRAAGVPRP